MLRGCVVIMRDMEKIQVILASKSPRRRELLKSAGVEFSVLTANVNEALSEEEKQNPRAAAANLADRKAGAVTQVVLGESPQGVYVVIGADTMVVLDNIIFGKPRNLDDGKRMLRALSGQTHRVITGVSVWMINALDPEEVAVGHKVFADESLVTFKELTDEEIADYLRKGESFDKAGAYAAQGEGAKLIQNIEGALDNVIGLPVEHLLEMFPQLRP